MPERLASTADGPVTQFKIEGAGHNGFYEVGRRKISQVMAGFLEELPR